MYTFILVLQVAACIVLIASVLLQPAKEGGFALAGGGGSSTQNISQANPLFKVSMYCGIFLLATSLLLSWHKVQEKQSSIIDGSMPPPAVDNTNNAATPEPPAAVTPENTPKTDAAK